MEPLHLQKVKPVSGFCFDAYLSILCLFDFNAARSFKYKSGRSNWQVKLIELNWIVNRLNLNLAFQILKGLDEAHIYPFTWMNRKIELTKGQTHGTRLPSRFWWSGVSVGYIQCSRGSLAYAHFNFGDVALSCMRQKESTERCFQWWWLSGRLCFVKISIQRALDSEKGWSGEGTRSAS